MPVIWSDIVAEWLLAEQTSGVIIEEADGEMPSPLERVSLISAFSAETDVETVVMKLRSLGRDLSARSGLDERLTVETRLIAPEELDALLAPSFRPVELTDGLWVLPAGDEEAALAVPAGAQVIRLHPGLAFGTGQHPSTRLAARLSFAWHERWDRPKGPRVLDLGTGSGLLAIAAVLWGAARAVGVDKDPFALENARRNVEENGLAQKVALVASDLSTMPGRSWADLLIANLDRDHFLGSSVELARWLAPGGSMVASGILVEHEEPVLGAFHEADLTVEERATEGSWVAFLLGPTPLLRN